MNWYTCQACGKVNVDWPRQKVCEKCLKERIFLLPILGHLIGSAIFYATLATFSGLDAPFCVVMTLFANILVAVVAKGTK